MQPQTRIDEPSRICSESVDEETELRISVCCKIFKGPILVGNYRADVPNSPISEDLALTSILRRIDTEQYHYWTSKKDGRRTRKG